MVLVFIDAFETMILPRRVRHGFRLARVFYRSAWVIWRAAARIFQLGRWRQAFLSIFGPLSLFALFFVWACGLMISFALLHWSLGIRITGADGSFLSDLYFSGTTFFTLGYGDRVPISPLGRVLSVVEAALGLVFLAVVISYLPVLYQAFSRREITIALLDARSEEPGECGFHAGRMGTLGSRAARKPHFVSGAELLPLAA
jgi:voltage-gated potassium channel Kch